MAEIEPTIEQREPQPYVGITRRVTMATVVPTLPDAGGELGVHVEANGWPRAGAPFWRYRVIDMEGELEVEVGVPLAEPAVPPSDSPVQAGTLPAGRYVTLTHVGHPDELEQVTGRLLAWASSRGLRWDSTEQPDGEHWGCRLEIYLSDPETEPDMTKWRTELAFKLAD